MQITVCLSVVLARECLPPSDEVAFMGALQTRKININLRKKAAPGWARL